MATSGFVGGNLNDGGQVYLAWQLAWQDGPTNRSAIYWQTGWRFLSSPLDRQLDAGYARLAGAERWRNNGRVKNVGTDYRVRDWQAASGGFEVYHDANGFLSFETGAGMTGYSNRRSEFGNVWFELPRIPKTPAAPTPIGIDQITPTSFRYRFSGNSDGGSPITSWAYRYSTTADFSAGVSSWIGSTGTSIVENLIPGLTYWVESRGQNAVGVGPASARISATTLPGGRLKVDGTWRTASPMVKHAGTWKRARPYVKEGGEWTAAT